MTGTAPRVWITRTLPGAMTTAKNVRALGMEPLVAPLLEVHAISDAMADAPAPDTLACIALTSPNTLSCTGEALRAYSHLPALAVGDTTAEAALKAGFENVLSAKGDIHDLARLIRNQAFAGTVFAPGARIPAGDLPALLSDRIVIRLPVYETNETEQPPPDSFNIVLVHSPRAAKILANRLSADQTRNRVAIAISEAAARPLQTIGFKKIFIASTPDEEGVLSALGNSASPV